MCSTVLRANASSASPISRRRSSLSARSAAGSWTAPDLPAADDDRVAVLQLVEQRGARRVDEQHPGLDEQQRAHVGVAVRRRAGSVDDRLDTARDQILGRDAVEVLVIDDRDIMRLQPLDEGLCALAEAGDAADLAHGRALHGHGSECKSALIRRRSRVRAHGGGR
jgi:hypothetical protein